MRRGTTPTHEFIMPIDADMIEEIEITYHQDKKEVITKHKKDCTLQGRSASVTLAQDETFLFEDGQNVEIQVRVLTNEDVVLASNIVSVSCERCLSDEVL